MISIRFEAKVHTEFGQKVKIVGNNSCLGNWIPNISGCELKTSRELYPIWRSDQCFKISGGRDVEFKIVVINNDCTLNRWESLCPNRIYTTNIRSPFVVLRIIEGFPSVEEYSDDSIQTIFESVQFNSPSSTPLKPRLSYTLNTIPEEDEETRIDDIHFSKNENKWKFKQKNDNYIPLTCQLVDQIKVDQEITCCLFTNESTKEQEENGHISNRIVSNIDCFYQQNGQTNSGVLVETTKLRLKNAVKQIQNDQIFFVYNEFRLNKVKALIFGLENTPYAHGGYIFDVFIPDEYPLVLPRVSIVYPNDNFTFFKSNLCTDELFNMKFLSQKRGDCCDDSHSDIFKILMNIQRTFMKDEAYSCEEKQEEKSKVIKNKEILKIQQEHQCKFYNVQQAICNMIENPNVEFEQHILTYFLKKRDALKITTALWIEEAKTCGSEVIGNTSAQMNQIIISGEKEDYLTLLQNQVDRMHILLDNLEKRIQNNKYSPC